jgi:NADH-quinone oxidoreductase subunit L
VPGGWHAVETFLEPVAEPLTHPEPWMEAFSPILSVTVAALGIWIAWRVWGVPSGAPERVRRRYPWAARTLEHKLYFDEAYDLVFYEPAARLAVELDANVEKPLILGSARGIAGSIAGLARSVAGAQSGLLRSYALVIAASLAVIVLVFVSVR